ncbi:hypothetical protein HK100_011618 [Physocladia obscura]|uniref:Uncharacterized protein n=1 Tax=Physocladia obscura TaxID=109957 RepID=A0AAD5XKP0_9FUNG|nr:hypothetical protein HK100_011618 [Physocladia obscura]
MRIATFILALTANAAITKSNSNSKKNDDGSSNSINSNSGKIISRSSVFTDLFATKDSRFDVRFVSASSTAPAADDTSILTTATFSVSLNSGNGIPTFFRCAIPAKSNSQNSTLQPPRSPDDDDDELASEEELALQHAKRNVWKGLEMLKGLEAHCLYFVIQPSF